MYNKSHTRASPYIIGMLSGNLFMKLQNSGYKLSQFTATVSFFFSVVVLGLCMASGNLLGLNNQAEYDPLISGIYAAVNRLVWAFGTAVFVLSLSFGDIRKWTYFWEIATLKTSIISFIYFGTSEYFLVPSLFLGLVLLPRSLECIHQEENYPNEKLPVRLQ